MASSSELRLVTIPISHYCEKARWALERAGIPYREERHVQAVHRFAARRAGGGSTVPVLVTPEGSIGESEEILDWIDARTPPEHRLQPADPAAREETIRLTRRFDAVLGPHGRRLMYVNMLTQRELMLTFNNQGVPAWEDRLLRVGFPFAVRWAKGALAIEPGIEVEDEAIVWQEFDYVAELLSDGRPYLVTDTFGAADLTFAALLRLGHRAADLRRPPPPARRAAAGHRRARQQGARAPGRRLRARPLRKAPSRARRRRGRRLTVPGMAEIELKQHDGLAYREALPEGEPSGPAGGPRARLSAELADVGAGDARRSPPPVGAASPPTSTTSATPRRPRPPASSATSPRSRGLIDALDLGPVALVVHDWGGFVGLAWACEHPDRVEALVISDAGFFADGKWHGMAQAMRSEQGEELVGALDREGFAGLLRSSGAEFSDGRDRRLLGAVRARARAPRDARLLPLDGLREARAV